MTIFEQAKTSSEITGVFSFAEHRETHEPATTPRPALVHFCGQSALRQQTQYDLHGIERVAIGRRPSNALCLSIACDDPAVSRRHAHLVRTRDRWTICDLASKNGMNVNGRSVPSAVLEPGDWFAIGDQIFVFAIAHPPQQDASHPDLATLHPQLQIELQSLHKVATTRLPVAVYGPTGSGKELVARAVHELSKRRGKFVAINCGALPAGLVDSAISGHKKGAFSGAHADQPGFARAASNGTLFLDEVGDLPLPAQASLLRILQEQEIVPVGDVTAKPVDARIVCATHRDLAAMVQRGEFRDDLLARLGGFSIRLPALRQRRMDLGTIIPTLLQKAASSQTKPTLSLTGAALRALYAHSWPHNIRELEHCLELAVALAEDGVVQLQDLPETVRAAAGAPDAMNEARLHKLLGEHRGNVTAIAQTTGKHRVQVRRWCKRFGLNPANFRP